MKDIIKKISIRWRMALKRIWNVPVNTHCDILPLISSQFPLEIQLKCRFLKFYRSLLESDNNLIRYLSSFKTFSNNSTMSNNLNQILCDLNLDMFELEMLSLNKFKNMLYDKWLSSVKGLYLIHSKYIHELCMMKGKFFFLLYFNLYQIRHFFLYPSFIQLMHRMIANTLHPIKDKVHQFD